MLDFKNYYDYSDFEKLININKEERTKKKVDFEKIFEEKDKFSNSFLNYLKDKAKNIEISIPKYSETHSSNFLKSWENLIKNKLTKNQEIKIKNSFKNFLDNQINDIIFTKEKNIQLEYFYENLIKKVNNGNFKHNDIYTEDACDFCNKKITLVGKNWNFALIEIDYKNNYKIKQLDKCMENKIYEINVEFKSGDLLIADWFRIQEFTEKVKYNKNYEDISINSAIGRLKSTEHAAKLGFVTVHVGNSCPTIYQDGDNFLFGYKLDYDNDNVENFKTQGMVCTDLWNVTIIDKLKLIEIVAETTGLSKAEEIVNEYIKENSYNINQIKISPGIYSIRFHPINETFDKNLDDKLPNEFEAYLSMKKFSLNKKMKMS